MKKLVLPFLFVFFICNLNAQNWKGNGFLGFGLLNPKLRAQYELPITNKFTVGANATYYFVNWKGILIEPFARIYGKSGSAEGFFGQFKLGYGNLGILDDELFEVSVLRWSTFGGGLGCGYKFLVGNHFTIEPYFGLRVYTGPNYMPDDFVSLGKSIGWGATTGLPIEFNWKVGYQF